VFERLAGYEDVKDAERLCRDPAMRWVVGDRAIARLRQRQRLDERVVKSIKR
jgi:hypothetical protein